MHREMSLENLVSDAEELVAFLCKRFQQKKVVIVCHSFGSYIGMHLVKRMPESIHTYIGIGQIVNWEKTNIVRYRHLYACAEKKKDNSLKHRLEERGKQHKNEKYSEDYADFLLMELANTEGEAGMHLLTWNRANKIPAYRKLVSPHLNWRDLFNNTFGEKPALYNNDYQRFINQVRAIDLPKELGDNFEVPIYFFTGEHDWQTPKTLIAEWFSRIKAPAKEMVWFENSAHFVVNEEPGKFILALMHKVFPH